MLRNSLANRAAKINCIKRLICRCHALQRAKDLRDTVMSRLRRQNRLCSSTVSDTANMSRQGSTLCSPTVEKILCRSLFSQRSHVGNLRQTLQGKRGDLQEGGKPQVVYPLVRPRGVSALPAAGRGKSPLNFSEKLTNPEYSSSRSAFCGSSLCGRENIPPSAR